MMILADRVPMQLVAELFPPRYVVQGSEPGVSSGTIPYLI